MNPYSLIPHCGPVTSPVVSFCNNFEANINAQPAAYWSWNTSEYPWQFLPLSMRQAVLDVHQELQAPLPLVAMSAMSAVSLACQDVADVQLHHGPRVPMSLNLLAIADSGERKTAVDAKFMQVPKAHEQRLQENHNAAQKSYNVDCAVWTSEEKALRKKLAQSKGDSNSDLKALMSDIWDRKPVQPKRPALIVQDITPQALVQTLSHRRSLGLISDEAGIILNGRATEQLPMLNALWSGTSYTVHRKASEDITLRDVRLTIGLMVQGKPFEKFLDKQGEQALDNGFFARFLVAKPISTQGNRFEYQFPISSEHSISKFNEKILKALELSENIKAPAARRLLDFSEDAKCALRNFSNEVEPTKRLGGVNYLIKGAASRIVENVERMAALFHVFEGSEGAISLEHTIGAMAICRWHLEQYRYIFVTEPKNNKRFKNAMELDTWFRTKAKFDFNFQILKNKVLNGGPSKVRLSVDVEPALMILKQWKILDIFQYHKRGAQIVQFNPNSLPLLPVTF